MLRTIAMCGALLAAPIALPDSGRAPRPDAKITIEEIGADTGGFNVLAVLVMGPTEMIVWDAQYHAADVSRLADRIAASKRTLRAIVISHPDEDHFMGATKLVERFPGTPVFMTQAAIDVYQKVGPQMLRTEKSRWPAGAPDSLVTARPLPGTKVNLDGETLEFIPDLQGDVLTPVNTALWIPSIRTVLAGDIAFNGVHPWLGSSDPASRERWIAALGTLAALNPEHVVAGHKHDLAAPDSPAVLDFMKGYLTDFEAARKSSADGAALRDAMMKKYGTLAVPMLLGYSAQIAYRKP